MQMPDSARHRSRRHGQDAAVAADLAAAFDVTPRQAETVVRCVLPELSWHLDANTLSRGGLADLVEALGDGHHARYLEGGDALRDPAARRDGEAILGHILGSQGRIAMLAARVARHAGLGDTLVRSMLPGLATVTMAALAIRARPGLSEVLQSVPALGRLSNGSPHADLADILRRGCGAGRYAPLALRGVVRHVLARAGGFPAGGAVRWYLQFLFARPVARLMQGVLFRLPADR